MYCIKCGKEIPDDSVFCPECGFKLSTSDKHTLTPPSSRNTTNTDSSPDDGKRAGMVLCLGCGKEIHETAFTCPNCGAPTSNSNISSTTGIRGSNYNPVNWYFDVLKQYTKFVGRAQRKEYWYFTLFSTIISIVLIIIDATIGTFNTEFSIGLLSGIYSLAVFIPYLAVTIRRLHDTNRSGWWCLVAGIPILGAIALIVFMASDSDPRNNQYGPSISFVKN
jgi:uncharacterized membrane protein YhaH (DUF805 family)/DNA-directed RNA polymerase subunit RPC12/RpoP